MRLMQNTFPVWTLVIITTGCAVGPNFHRPLAPKLPRYTEQVLKKQTVAIPGNRDRQIQTFVKNQTIPRQWWILFHSRALNRLIEIGLHNNPNLMAAKAALKKAQEDLRAQIGTSFFPNISAQLSGNRQRPSFLTNTQSTSVYNLYNASVNVSYTFDFFGGARRAVEAAHAQVDYQYYELQAAYLSLTANIVTSAVTTAALYSQIQVLQQLILEQKQQLAIVEEQAVLGAASALDIAAQKTLVAQTRAQLPPVQKQYEQTRDTLATLLGNAPSQIRLPQLLLSDLHLPRKLPLSLPAQFVAQRPDIQAALALLHQASAHIGVATANLFPQITLSGNYGSEGTRLPHLFNVTNLTWSLGTQLVQPLFEGGALLAQKRSSEAAYQQACAVYRATVLSALQNVADTLVALNDDAKLVRAQKQAELAARTNLRLVRYQLQVGSVSYLDVLNAQKQYRQARLQFVQAQALRYADTAALFQALGGGWWQSGRTPAHIIGSRSHE